ncbi:MAG: hypothetical protein IJ258_05300 [Methanobrevibacter sp.]|uniref:hypothetical protein n=1 Tax=Methanobrevibacter sp. TaxID=66852 RepID=UPI0025F025C7|nr:hypothetical protein [Methanobrevibacter sp.]MBQ8017506.1 hypothetical protein [Methanobrevibacter sp.]
MISVYDKFQRDIRDGATISESLSKYNLTLKDAFDYLNHPPKKDKRPRRIYNKVAPFIYEVNGKYHIRRRNKKGLAMFYGSFNSLSDAEKIIQWYNENAWDKRRLDYACEQLGIERNKRGGNHK